MKICLATREPSEAAGTIRFVKMAECLRRQGHHIVLVSFDRVIYYTNSQRLERPVSRSRVLWLVFVLSHTLRSNVLHVMKAYPTIFLLVVLARIAHKRVVLDLNDWDSIGGFASYPNVRFIDRMTITALEELLPRICSGITTTSRVLQRRVLDMGVKPCKVTYLPGLIDTAQFNPRVDGSKVRRELQVTGKVVGYLGTISHAGVPWRTIVDIAAEIARSGEDVVFLVIGAGPALSEMRHYATETGCKMIFTGRVPHAEVPNYLAACDILLHVLNTDYPDILVNLARLDIKLLEYMGMAKPIVSSEVGEAGKLLCCGAGLLVSDNKPLAYANAIRRIIHDGALSEKLAAELAKRVDDYSCETQGKVLEQFYHSLGA